MFRITQKPKFLVLCILDGWGIKENYQGNAITQAQCSNFNSLWFSFPHTLLATSGLSVGLPEGQVGNSEVGHLNLGAGRIVFQDQLRINLVIDDGSFYQKEAFNKATDHIHTFNSKIHLLGLVGSGSVHSKIEHLFALLKLLKQKGVNKSQVKLHLFTDGRDSPPTSAKIYIAKIDNFLESLNFGQIASISGRYYAMDRDNRWDRTQKAYSALLGESESRLTNALAVIEQSYTSGITDEFIVPTVIVDKVGEPVGPISPNDAVIFFNYRPDRARQLTKAFVLDDLTNVKASSGGKVTTFARGPKLSNLFFVTFTQYEAGLPVSEIAFKPHQVSMPLARVFSERNLHQLHIAETEKYAHVTYFFNGGKEMQFPGEDRILVNSPKVASYDLAPEMSAGEITQKLISKINSRSYNFIVVNFANADMVGHTGNLQATVEAVQTIDLHLGTISKAVLNSDGCLVITADHGNAEEMTNPQTGQIDTEHNDNPAPCVIANNQLKGNNTMIRQGILADVAPTILSILKIPKPSQMTGRNLLE